MNLLNNNSQFNVLNINNNPSLVPSSALLEICNSISNPFPQSSCILRYDIISNILSSTAFQINNNNDSKQFIKSIFNYDNDFIYDLGNNFSSYIIDYYKLTHNTNKYRKAFWINPSFNWIGAGINGDDRFTLSQWIITISLININQNSTSNRRLLINKNTYNNNLINIQNNIDPAYILALNLNISYNLTSIWFLKMNLNKQQILLSHQDLISNIHSILYNFIIDCSSPILNLGIISIDIDNYNRRNDDINIISNIEFLFAFKDVDNPYFDIQKFLQNPNILSIQPIKKSPIIILKNNIIIDNINNNDNQNKIIIITITTLCSFIIMIFIILYLFYKNKKLQNINNNIECSVFFPDLNNNKFIIDSNNNNPEWLIKL